MLVSFVMVLAVAAGLQSPPPDRTRAEELARSGHTVEAIAIFERIVDGNPADVEARVWIATLELRLGQIDQAEAGFRSVIREHPADVDARIGLGRTLTRKGEWREALAVLHDVERDAGANADLLGALGRANRRAGNDRLAFEYYKRAKALAPDYADVVDAYEAAAHVYRHSLEFEAFGDGGASDARSGSLTVGVRVVPRLRVDGIARVQDRSGSSDALGGVGTLWRVGHYTTLDVRAVGGSGNTSLPNVDVMGAVVNYLGAFEIGGSFRGLSFADARVIAASPVLAWDPGGTFRFDGRYTYSRASFDATGESSGDHSVMVRETWRAWRRVGMNFAYAYGIESFEDLTADRLQNLGATTVAVGLRIHLPSLTLLAPTWEHQWRSNDTRMDRLTLSVVQTFP